MKIESSRQVSLDRQTNRQTDRQTNGMRDALIPYLMKDLTPRMWSNLRKAFFQPIVVARTATESPFEQLSVAERILSMSLKR